MSAEIESFESQCDRLAEKIEKLFDGLQAEIRKLRNQRQELENKINVLESDLREANNRD